MSELNSRSGKAANSSDSDLCNAIHQGRLHEVCCEWLKVAESKMEPERVRQLHAYKQACETIAAEVNRKRSDVLRKFAAAGAKLEPESDPASSSAMQYHSFSLSIAEQDVPKALVAAIEVGFHVDDVLMRRADRLARARGWIDLMAWDDASFRMRLHWRDESRLRSKLMPDPVDVAMIPLPRPLVFGYSLLKPLRKIFEAATGLKTEDRIGLRAGHLSLGTPLPLVDGLLATVGLETSETLMDLGCGDGRVLIHAARTVGCEGIGVERNSALIRLAEQNAVAETLSQKLSFVCGQIKDAPLGKANVIFLFLPPRLLNSVLNLLKTHARPGTRIIAHEQQRLKTDWPASEVRPVVSRNAITVGHIWRV